MITTYHAHCEAINRALADLVSEPADVRTRIAIKLRTLADAVGDMDPVTSDGIMDVASFLEVGHRVPRGTGNPPPPRRAVAASPGMTDLQRHQLADARENSGVCCVCVQPHADCDCIKTESGGKLRRDHSRPSTVSKP